ncbi:unnamed protein product [Soboliphyme baturini]|uniref:Flap endonuclease 1 n=1 Tax=Soboliphyme baturini TaxID=241478 RepID=A0A183IV08_9BILA|nr:unnamed protein product [Soboliphyme baturini]
MGIKDLTKVICDNAPNSVSEHDLKYYFGRKVAIDASMSIYQFLIAVRQDGSQLSNDAGETTSHLLGMFYRTIRMVENGIKPIYVFDGKPPEMKGDELQKRTDRRIEAKTELDKAVETGDTETIDKLNRRLVKVSKEQTDECKKLLRLMGIPIIEAPGEAEAQCAALVNAGVVYGAATEDMDTLTFGSNVLLRHMTKMPIKEFRLADVLQGMKLNKNEFVDLCILLGCDYCPTIKGIGPKKAYELIKTYHSIEEILKHIDAKLVANFFTITWSDPDEEGLVEFLVRTKNFNEVRVRNGAAKLMKARHTATQGRIDNFFTVVPATNKRKVRILK